jgi:hypothetical protein
MGLSTIGLAFRPISPTMTADEIVRNLFGPGYHHDQDENVRKAVEIAIEINGDACFVYNADLVKPHLFGEAQDCTETWRSLGKPSNMAAFCHLDPGGAWGYVIFEQGMSIRRRLDQEEKVIDEGEQKDYETQAAHEWAEGDAPGMLRCVLISLFGGCPWDKWNYRNEPLRYRRAGVL